MRHIIHDYILNPQHPLSVSVIGCGGTGSQVLTALGRMNYALQKLGHPGLHVIAYDADTVTEANCGRQLFSEAEVGLNKATALITKLNYFFGTAWEAVPEMYGKGQSSANITVSCVDTAAARLSIRKTLKDIDDNRYHTEDFERVYYWLDFGNLANTGQVVLGTVGQSFRQNTKKDDCEGYLRDVTEMFDLTAIDDRNNGPSCSLAEALTKQDLFINSTLANIGMALMWKMFSGIIENQGTFLNLETMCVNPIMIVKHGKK